MISKPNTLRVTMVLIATAALAACGSMYSGRPHLNHVSELQADEIVLVGRIELVPPLSAAEQQLRTATSGRFLGKATGIFSDRIFDLNNLPMTAGNHAVMAEMGKEFYARQRRSKEILYSGSFVLTKSSASHSGYMGRRVSYDTGQINLPGGLKFSVRPDDRAIYIGTIRYHRDDYNAITKVEMINDYKRVNKAFVAKFGKGIKLRYVKPKKI